MNKFENETSKANPDEIQGRDQGGVNKSPRRPFSDPKMSPEGIAKFKEGLVAFLKVVEEYERYLHPVNGSKKEE